jgi:hypothetical protein
MKRGLITWDRAEMPPAVFAQRLQLVRTFLASQHLPALVVYSELWRSNPARFFSNFMPYFNRALLVLPLEGTPTLLCGLSPRVYPWIRSVTTIEDVTRGNFVHPLMHLAASATGSASLSISTVSKRSLQSASRGASHDGARRR